MRLTKTWEISKPPNYSVITDVPIQPSCLPLNNEFVQFRQMKVRTEYVKLFRHMKPSEVNLEDRCNQFGGRGGEKKKNEKNRPISF